MSWRSVLGGILSIAAAWTGNFWYFAGAMAVNARDAHFQRKTARGRARDAYNASLADRLQMVERAPDQARTLCLGRVRNVEGIRRYWTSGANDELLTLIVSFAGHEIDGYEAWYLNDQLVTLDVDGWVQEAPYMQTARQVDGAHSGTLDGGGNGSATLPHTPIGGTVRAYWTTGSGDGTEQGALTVGGSGVSVTVSGGPPGAAYTVFYEYAISTSHVRIRPYLGTDAQNVGADIAAEFPGKITSTDRFAGIACAVVTLTYSQDVFPQGYPAVTPVFRGARCYDPRLDDTVAGGAGTHRIDDPATWAWTENPALHALRYAMWPHGWALLPGDIGGANPPSGFYITTGGDSYVTTGGDSYVWG